MGQYFIAVNRTKRQWLHPHRFGDGMKLKELMGSADGLLAGLGLLLTPEAGWNDEIVGSWAGDDVSIVGDYGSSGLYAEAMDSHKDVSFGIMRAMARDAWIRASMMEKTAWRWRLPKDFKHAIADQDEQEFYKELFDGRNH